VRQSVNPQMGQYYICIFLAEDGKYIRAAVHPDSYSQGSKLTEHSYMDTHFMNAVEYMLSPKGMFYKSRLVWAGDYADPEENANLYSMALEMEDKAVFSNKKTDCNFILNHTKKLFIDKCKLGPNKLTGLHPLPLLTSEGNGSGGGDYFGHHKELCGTWARDIISLDSSNCGYEEFVPEFS